MRLVLAVFVLAACTSKPSAAPAWPKHDATIVDGKEGDGGESIEPRAKASAVAKADDEATVVAATPAAADKPATPAKTDAETPKPATPGATQAPDDIVITTEEIVIEIDE